MPKARDAVVPAAVVTGKYIQDGGEVGRAELDGRRREWNLVVPSTIGS